MFVCILWIKLDDVARKMNTDTAELIEYAAAQFIEELDLPEETPEEKEKMKKLQNKIMIINYNENVRIYNELLERGFFS